MAFHGNRRCVRMLRALRVDYRDARGRASCLALAPGVPAPLAMGPAILGHRGLVFAVSNAGRLAAIELRSGRRLWDIDTGSTQTPWVAGDYVFALTNAGQLIAVMRRTGRIRWAIRLANFIDESDLKKGVSWVGPVLASDRLIIAGSHGQALSVSPYTGAVIGWIDTGRAVVVQPVVANNTIYFLDRSGRLTAMR